MIKCSACGDEFEPDFVKGGKCGFCRRREDFAAFARQCGLKRYPDPSGERYVYRLDGKCAGKKSENINFIDELWNALVRSNGGDDGLLFGGG